MLCTGIRVHAEPQALDHRELWRWICLPHGTAATRKFVINLGHTHTPHKLEPANPRGGILSLGRGIYHATTSPLQCKAVIATTVQWYAKCRATTKNIHFWSLSLGLSFPMFAPSPKVYAHLARNPQRALRLHNSFPYQYNTSMLRMLMLLQHPRPWDDIRGGKKMSFVIFILSCVI